MHLEVPGAYLLVMPNVKMLGEVISNIFLAWMPLDIKVSFSDLICGPEEYFIHGSRVWLLDSVICNSHCCEIVTVYLSWGLDMS